MNLNAIFRTTLLAASIAALPVAASANVTNGSFEDPVLGSGATAAYNNGSTDIVGWTVIGTNVQLVDQAYAAPGLTLTASAGQQWVDLTGMNEGLGKGLTQTFGGTGGQQYSLTFDIGRLFDRGDAYIDVNVNGVSQIFSNTDVGNGNVMGWKSASLLFIGQASNTVTFLGVSGGSTNLIGLDNVNVTAVPEPETYAMMLAGLGVMGFLGRRRKQG